MASQTVPLSAVPRSGPTLLHRTDCVPENAVPLVLLVDRYAVADFVTVLGGESLEYADDVQAAALALFEGVLDVLLVGTDLTRTYVVFDGMLRPAGLWAGRGRRRLKVRPEQAVRLLIDAFTPYVRGGEDTLGDIARRRRDLLLEPIDQAAAAV